MVNGDHIGMWLYEVNVRYSCQSWCAQGGMGLVHQFRSDRKNHWELEALTGRSTGAVRGSMALFSSL